MEDQDISDVGVPGKDPKGKPPDPPDGYRPPNLDHKMDVDHATSILIHATTGRITNVHPKAVKEFVLRQIGQPRDLKKL